MNNIKINYYKIVGFCLTIVCFILFMFVLPSSNKDDKLDTTTTTLMVTQTEEQTTNGSTTKEETTDTVIFTTPEIIDKVEIPAEEEIETSIEGNTSNKSNYVNSGKFKLTAYCGGSCCCGKWAGSPTASGTWPKQGRTIAVYPSQIPYGTEVTIEGYGTYIAEDCGGAIGYNCIDIYMDSHSAAQEFGIRYAMVSW